MNLSYFVGKRIYALASLLIVVSIAVGPPHRAQAAGIDMVAGITVNTGTVVPDFSDFEPGGSQAGETPTGTLVIDTSGLDGSNAASATASRSTASGPGTTYDTAQVRVSYANEANFAFDVFDIFFDFNVSGLLTFASPFEEAPVAGHAAAMFVRNDGNAGPGTGSVIELFGADFPPPRASLSEFSLDAFTASVPVLRLNPGESATFVIDLKAEATVVPLPASLTFLLLALGGLAGATRWRRPVRSGA